MAQRAFLHIHSIMCKSRERFGNRGGRFKNQGGRFANRGGRFGQTTTFADPNSNFYVLKHTPKKLCFQLAR